MPKQHKHHVAYSQIFFNSFLAFGVCFQNLCYIEEMDVGLKSYVKSKIKVHEKIHLLEDSNGSVTDNIFNICKTLNDYFYTVFEVELQGPPPNFLNRSPATSDKGVDFITNEIVKNRLLKLDSSKATGLDEIHARVLKNCAETFSVSLTMLSKSSILTSFVPDQWRKAEVTPIFKKGSKLKASNYRLVSQTSVPCKVLKGLIHNCIMQHCVKNKLITPAQHGLVKHRGCKTNLLEPRDIVTDAINQGFTADVIYTDFSKAFDKVAHLTCQNITEDIISTEERI
ncbi:uncharacterized protein LOC136074461 [Hydra vulgaris]|uniref:Uncharacterized protein LOC136074461 n=1 Tax=Hydra vulgaris TaxID=6087 RepID=A0ABM4B232_HYDVU